MFPEKYIYRFISLLFLLLGTVLWDTLNSQTEIILTDPDRTPLENGEFCGVVPAAAVGCLSQAVAVGLAGGLGSAGWSVSSAGTEAGSSGTPEGSLWS